MFQWVLVSGFVLLGIVCLPSRRIQRLALVVARTSIRAGLLSLIALAAAWSISPQTIEQQVRPLLDDGTLVDGLTALPQSLLAFSATTLLVLVGLCLHASVATAAERLSSQLGTSTVQLGRTERSSSASHEPVSIRQALETMASGNAPPSKSGRTRRLSDLM